MKDRRGYSFKESRQGALIAVVVLVVVIGIVLGAVYLYDKFYGGYQGGTELDVDMSRKIEYNGQVYVINPKIETFLLIGLDTSVMAEENGSYNNDKQADVIVMFILDKENKTCHAIHVDPNTMTEVPVLGVTGQRVGTETRQIAFAHTYGRGGIESARNVAVAVSQLLQTPVNNCISLTMDGLVALNDLVGGVTLTVDGDFSGVDDTLVGGEEVILLGEHAFNYLQSRNGGLGLTRMNRQRQYMQALYQEIMRKISVDDRFLLNAISGLGKHTVTSLDVTSATLLFEKLSSYEFTGIDTLDGEIVLGEEYIEFIYDEEALKALVVELCYIPQK